MSDTITYAAEYPNFHESNWSLVNKTLRFNNIRFSELKEIIVKDRNYNKYHYNSVNLNFTYLRELAGLCGEVFDSKSYLSTLTEGFEHLNLHCNLYRHDHLKFCPTCIKYGFHSPFYMTPFISHCPIHEVELSEICPACHRNIPHVFSRNALINPYGCPNCGCDFFIYKDKKKPIDTTSLDEYILEVKLAREKSYNWEWLFNFDKFISSDFSEISSIIIMEINGRIKNSNYGSATLEFKDTDKAIGKYWREAQLPWNEQPNMLQNGFTDCLTDMLINSFYKYRESSTFSIVASKKKAEKIEHIIDSWERVWVQRVSHFKEFGRLKLLQNFVIDKISSRGAFQGKWYEADESL